MSDKQAEVKGHEWTPDSRQACCSCGKWCCANSGEYHGIETAARELCQEQHAAHLAALASQPERRETVCAVHHVHLCGICSPGVLASQVPAQPPAANGISSPWCDTIGCVKHYGHEGSHSNSPTPVPAQGTPPAHPRTCSQHGSNRHHDCVECRNLGNAYRESLKAAPASPQVGEGLEQECADFCVQLVAGNSTASGAGIRLAAFIRTKLRAALAESDKLFAVANEVAKKQAHTIARLDNKLERARAEALEEAEKSNDAHAAWLRSLNNGITLKPTYEYAATQVDAATKKLRALAAQPTPAPKEQR
jgi:hypothetical protein